MLKAAFLTLGCKVNQADSAAMEEVFRRAGYEIVSFSQQADVYVVNTCVVTNVAQNKSKQMIRRAVRMSPSAIVAVCGCYAQTSPAEVKAIAGVQLVLGNDKRNSIVELVEKVRASGYTDAVTLLDKQTNFEEMLSGNVENRTRAYLKIQEGCNQYCSYCIIPYARGPVRSRSIGSITSETERLVAQGFKEIVLIGIHLGAYGVEKNIAGKLSDAVQAVLSVKGVQRLRLGSLESIEVEERLIDLFAKDTRLCRHLHLPLQSGCDDILQAMRRPYSTKDFTRLLRDLKNAIPGLAVTSDVIVGFPGETQLQFEKTLSFITNAAFSDVHIFPFSARKGTPAAQMQGQITKEEKSKRVKSLAEIVEKQKEVFLQELVGKTLKILFEQPDGNGYMSGFTQSYVKVFVPENREFLGEIKEVSISCLKDGALYGSLI